MIYNHLFGKSIMIRMSTIVVNTLTISINSPNTYELVLFFKHWILLGLC